MTGGLSATDKNGTYSYGLGGWPAPFGQCSGEGTASIHSTIYQDNVFAGTTDTLDTEVVSGCLAGDAHTLSGRATFTNTTSLRLNGADLDGITWSGEVSVALTRVAADLGIGQGTASDTISVQRAGDRLSLAVYSIPGGMSAIADSAAWVFTPDDGSPQRPACDRGADLQGCVSTIDRPGVISTKGYANGGPYSDARPIHVRISAPPDLTLVCAPATLLRGESTQCTASLTDGSAITVTGWHFASTDSLLPTFETDGTGGATWGGIMVVSGVVTVTARIATSTLTKSTTILVTRRDWSKLDVPFTITPVNTYTASSADSTGKAVDVQVSYVDPPHDVHQLGQNAWLPSLVVDATKLISEGPNAGLAYFTALPFRLDFRVSYNERAMQVGSSFYSMQASSLTKKAGVTYCARSRVIDDIPLVKKHEGYSINDLNSHTDVVFRTFNAFVRIPAERMVGYSSDLNPLALLKNAEKESNRQTRLITDATTGTTNPYQTNCVFNYDPAVILP